jgi:hypothetical protein
MGGHPESSDDCALGGVFLYVAVITSFWVPDAFRYSVFGLLGECLLGLLGLFFTIAATTLFENSRL